MNNLTSNCLFVKLLFVAVTLATSGVAGVCFANNIQLSAPSLVDKDTGNDHWNIRFDISWENSWLDADAPAVDKNWDAAWVFAKFSKWQAASSSWSAWAHCTLSSADVDHAAPAGSQIDTGLTAGAGKGIFMYRSAAGTGTNTWTGAKMHWLYGTDGVADSDVVKVKVFGLEMVYIPTGSFYIGDGVADAAQFRWQDGTAGAVLISSSLGNAFNASSTNNNYDDDTLKQPGAGFRIDGDGGIYDAAGTSLNAAFPTGYSAFYMMKYELSQGQYRDFLNMLTRAQQDTRTVGQTANYYAMSNTVNVNYRSGIRNPAAPLPTGVITFGCDLEGITANDTTFGDGVFNEENGNDGEWVAANYLSWADGTAFADWAALRPFTELEFEKAARGPMLAVANEYAWGNITISAQTGAMVSSGYTNETVPQGNANYSSSLTDGPFRVGIFATASSTTRTLSGAGYYGVMELSGNLWERPVTIGNNTGRAFTGLHGDGALDASGNANASAWPGTGATGSGFRGGAWNSGASNARVSDRLSAANSNGGRNSDIGARCTRASP